MTAPAAAPRREPGTAGALLAAAHGGPTLAVTTVTAVLTVAAGLEASTAVVVTLAVLTGQLTIGWGNDLVDARRDAAVGRTDKPLADGRLDAGLVQVCLAGAAVTCVVASSAAGWRTGLVHLGLVVAAGHAYNLGLKATVLSWLPYAAAFGALPAVVSLAAPDHAWPAWWLMAVGAALGVGAHLLNVLPDLDDDASTGVRGLPHRLGAAACRVLAAVVLAGASVVVVLGPGDPRAWGWAALGVVGVLAVVAATGRGRTPFRAAVAIALVDVVLLLVSA